MKTYGRRDASYGMLRYLDNLEDDELVAVVFEMRLLQDEHGHEDRRGWDIACSLVRGEE